jgi:hypothetical protein
MSVQTIIYKDHHLFFTTDLITYGHTQVFMPLDWWVCSKGLMIWLNHSATNLKPWMDGKKSGIDGTQSHPKVLLLTLEGELFHLEFTLTNGINGDDDEKYCRLMPMGEGVSWAYSGSDSLAEKGQAAMLIGETREEIQDLMIRSDIRRAENYKWYKVEDLLTQVKAIHAKNYPTDLPTASVATSKEDAGVKAHGCI